MTEKQLARFISKVSVLENGCWNWEGAHNPDGYGMVGLGKKVYSAHRAGYLHFIGEIPLELELDHTCSNRSCVNPEHLQAIDHLANCQRRMKVSCKRGHEYSQENTYNYGSNRRCRLCNLLAVKKYKLTKLQ